MATFLSVSNKLSTSFNSIQELMSKKHFDEIMKSVGAKTRNRKFDFCQYMKGAMTNLARSNEKKLTLCSIYNNYASMSYVKDITKKCVHKQLDRVESLETLKTLLEEMLALTSKKFMQNIKKIVPDNLDNLLKLLKVEDIIFIDGTVIDLRPECLKEMDCKNSGADRIDGKPSRPGLKLHIAFSLRKETFEYVDVTGALDNERDHVYANKFKNCLIIADRGYISLKLLEELENADCKYILRGKKNMSNFISKAWDENGKSVNKIVGERVRNLKLKKSVDLETFIETEDSEKKYFRVIRRRNPMNLDDKNSDSLMILVTNLDREIVSGEQLSLLYRMRWGIEIFNKVCKSYSNLQSVNSKKQNIIMQFIVLCLMTSLIKTFFGMTAKINTGLKVISMIKLHKDLPLFPEILESLIGYQTEKFDEIMNKISEHISLYFLRESPSERDQILLKDLHLQIDTVLKLGAQ